MIGSPDVDFKVSPGAGGLVDMRDPFSGFVAFGSALNIILDGPGAWKLAGESKVEGFGAANFTVGQGRLYLGPAGKIILDGGLAASSFILRNGATLALGGATEIQAGDINLESGAILAFDLANGANLALSGSSTAFHRPDHRPNVAG